MANLCPVNHPCLCDLGRSSAHGFFRGENQGFTLPSVKRMSSEDPRRTDVPGVRTVYALTPLTVSCTLTLPSQGGITVKLAFLG